MTTSTLAVAAPRAEKKQGKFEDPFWTAAGQLRGAVPFERYHTVWFNTGTLCNIACHNCYIDSSPKSDQLAYLSADEVISYLDEADGFADKPSQIGFTGGEPFMNPAIIRMLEESLVRGFRVLVLTNAMRPMQRFKHQLVDLNGRFPDLLSLRVSLDHFDKSGHEAIRGPRTWEPAMNGLRWLIEQQFDVAVAGRRTVRIDEADMRAGYAELFGRVAPGLLDADDPSRLVLFPEMDDDDFVPEITEACWGILKMAPSQVMCSSSRMVLKRKGEPRPVVVACTLIPYSAEFELGETLEAARQTVQLNHRHCAKFCVLGKASCAAT